MLSLCFLVCTPGRSRLESPPVRVRSIERRTGVSRRKLGVLVAALLLGCQALGGGESTTGPTEGDLREETLREPGLPSDRGSMGATEGRLAMKPIYFDFDDSTLRGDAKERLRRNAELLRARSDTRIEIQGHCDERGTEEYNLALGQRRAEAAKRYLIDLGVRRSRVETKTFGEGMPAVRGHDETAWAKNRRDEFVALR